MRRRKKNVGGNNNKSSYSKGGGQKKKDNNQGWHRGGHRRSSVGVAPPPSCVHSKTGRWSRVYPGHRRRTPRICTLAYAPGMITISPRMKNGMLPRCPVYTKSKEVNINISPRASIVIAANTVFHGNRRGERPDAAA
mmetsp:Transcript_15933/g.25137  ORF Transcript_15933/g.25137 Transcript_15933/m.25137 type:complete len:137 (+) Transcript_15933:260-670(+)